MSPVSTLHGSKCQPGRIKENKMKGWRRAPDWERRRWWQALAGGNRGALIRAPCLCCAGIKGAAVPGSNGAGCDAPRSPPSCPGGSGDADGGLRDGGSGPCGSRRGRGQGEGGMGAKGIPQLLAAGGANQGSSGTSGGGTGCGSSRA